ncbi:glycerophosphodiester phosphodiesterase [Lacipirellula parvula]|uniref:Glycerophosphoryl diester phosphodiesterase n=1 Tax=Lacipirellula parvula TaxID=2650471 RepID=A0A5K7X2C7_9BACT|nr:glycerophosphodiester phosphodiesterase [Lacipirellula parvula]BBO30485.1 glycerophosphoryl diester phosphodiesterase [Lacipirellula parvula]
MAVRFTLALGLGILSALAGSVGVVHAQNIVAHRGASFDAPENTVASMKLAFEQGADGVEADFYLSSDGEIVCIHDADTKRTAGVKHVIVKTPLAELRKLDVGAWKNEKYRGEKIPTFAEIAETIPAVKKFIIELKTGPEIVAPLKEALAKTKLKDDQILIICFNEKTVAECKKLLPNLKCHWLTGYKQNEKTGEWTPTLDEVVATLERSKADGLGTQGDMKHVDAEFIKELCDEGHCEFHVWTIDNPKVAKYYQKLKPWGITTNKPGFIREQLNAKSTKVPAAAAK